MVSRRGLAAGDVEGRLEGALSRFAEFRDRILEKTSWRVLELSAEFRLVSRAVILEGLYNLLSERLDEPRGLVDGVVLVGRTGRWLATSRLELLAGTLVPRLLLSGGRRRSRLEDGDGFRMSRFEFVDERRACEEDRGLGLADFEVRVVVTVLGNLGIRNGDVVRAVAGDLVRRVAGRADVLRPEGVLEREGCAEPRLDPREGNLTVLRDDGLREAELRELGLREVELRVDEERVDEERVDGAAELRDEPDREDERLTERVEVLGRLEERGEREALLEDRPELRDDERPEDF